MPNSRTHCSTSSVPRAWLPLSSPKEPVRAGSSRRRWRRARRSLFVPSRHSHSRWCRSVSKRLLRANYTPYRLAFRLANNGKEWDDKEVERDAALKGIMRWVRLHPYNISQKVQIVVEHFRENVAPLLEERAKAMVVLGSRVEAVRWQLAIEKYIKSRGYKIGTLVAFSGEANDSQPGPDALTEPTKVLNPGLQGRKVQ